MEKIRSWLGAAMALLFTGCYAASGYYTPVAPHSYDGFDPFDGDYLYIPDGRYDPYDGLYGPSFRFRFGYPGHRIHRFKGHHPGYHFYPKPFGHRGYRPYLYENYRKFNRYGHGRFVRPYRHRPW